nr:DUF5056 domain-containing protein [Microbulbifer sediminum]
MSEAQLRNSDPDFDAWLGQQLQFSEPYLDDDGFCDGVMERLPAPTRRSEKRVTHTQYAAVVLASAIVAWQFPFAEVVSQAASQSISLYSLLGLGVLSSVAAMFGGIVAARR